MQAANNAEYTRLSNECQRHMRAGLLEWYSRDLKSMAKILDREKKYTDEAKTLMIAFYIDLSGVGEQPWVDWDAISNLRRAVQKANMDLYAMRGLFLDAVRRDTTPRHIMRVTDAMYVLELSLSDRNSEVATIIDRFRLENRVK